MSQLITITTVAADHGLKSDYVNKLFNELGLPLERTRSPRSNRWCNATTPEGAEAFEQLRTDAGFHKLIGGAA